MANKVPKTKKEKLESDDLFFDNDLDFGDFDFDADNVPDDRNPVTSFAYAAAEGVGKKLQDSLVRDSIKKSFPSGYGEALDVLDSGTSSIRTLYDTAAKELKPVKRDLQRITAKVLPKISDKLPGGIRTKLESFSKEDDDGAGQRRDYEEELLQASLNEVFAKRDAQDDVKGQLKESIDQTRFNNNIFQLNEIRKSTRILSEYQTNIGINFHRRSLEIQYRHYFTAQKTLEEIKKTFAMQETAFKVISKNTGLPEFAKLRNGERFQEHMRNQFIDKTVGSVFGKGANFIPNLIKNITEAGVGKIRDSVGNLGNLTSQASMVADMADGGMGAGELGGAIAGDLAGDTLIGKLNKHVIKPLVDKSPGIKKFGNKLSYMIGNAGSLANDWADQNDFDYGVTGDAKDFLRQQVKSTLAGDNQLTGMKVTDLDMPASWNLHNSKSINEIIPGLLARLHREVKILRTGDVGTKMISFDVGSGKFTNDDAAVSTLAKKVFDESKVNTVNYRGNDILKRIGADNLPEEQRQEIIAELLQMSIGHKTASKDRLTDSSSWKGDNGSKYAEAFGKYFEDDELDDKKVGIAASVREMSRGIDLDHQEIQAYVNAGYGAQLEQLGIIKNGKVDYKEYALRLMSGRLPTFDDVIDDGGIAAAVGSSSKKVIKQKHISQKITTTNNSNTVNNNTQLDLNIDPLLRAIEGNNVKPEVIDINECLKRIEELISKGININMGGTGGDVGGESAPVSSSWRDMTLGNGISNLLQFGFGTAKAGVGKILSGANWSKNKLLSLGGAGFGLGKKAGAWALGKLPDIEEVWIPGKDKAVLVYSKLKNGDYISSVDASVIIVNLKTLKKAIQLGGQILDKAKLDEEGKPSVVCDVDELVNAVMVKKGKIIGKLTAVLGGAKDLFVKGAGLLKDSMLMGFNVSLGAIGVAKWAGKAMFSIARNLVNGPQDIYVKGEDEPRLFATIMKVGGYISKITGKVIERPTDIDGEVLYNGNVIISFDDIKKGLVTSRGKKLLVGKGFIGRLLHGAGAAVGGSWRALKSGAKKVGQFLADGFSYTKDFLKSVFGEGIIITSKKTISVLEEIRDLLDARLPGKKKVFGDKDGDGIRDNSVDDLAKKDAEAEKAKASKSVGAEGAAKKAGFIGSMKAGWDKMRAKEKEEEALDAADGSLLEDAADLAEIGDFANGDGEGKERGGKGKKRPGRFKRGMRRASRGVKRGGGKLGRLGGRGLSAAGKGLGGLAKGAGGMIRNVPGGKAGGALALATGGLAAYSISQDDTLASSEKNTAYMDIGGAASGGLAGAALGATVGSVVPIVGTVIGGLVGGVIGGVIGSGIGSTVGNILFNKSLGELAKLRYVQYGFTADDKRYTQPIYDLEQMMQKAMIKGPTGVAFDPGKINAKEMMALFGREINDPKGSNAWAQWMLQRFKPVYLAHANALAKIKPSVTLSDVDAKLSATEKYQFVNGATVPESVYTVLASPVKELAQLAVGPGVATRYVDALKAKLKLEADKEKKTTGTKSLDIPASAAAAGGVKALGADGKPIPTQLGKDGKPIDPAKNKVQLDNPGHATAAIAVGAVVTASGNFETVDNKGTLSDLETIFMKTIGLNEMDKMKIANVRRLITMVLPRTIMQNKIASFNGNSEEIFRTMSSEFGCDYANAVHSEFFNKWMLNRFIPTYLNLVTSLFQTTGNIKTVLDLSGVKGDAKLSAAIVVIGTVTPGTMGATPVWSINTSPWPDYTLNSRLSSAEGNMKALKDSLGTATIKDAISDLNKKKSGSVMDSVSKMLGNIGSKITDGYDSAKKQVSGAIDATQKVASQAWQGTKNAASDAYTGTKQVLSDTVSNVKDAAGGVADFLGGAMQKVGAGIGGVASSLPMPNGPEGKWSSVKELFAKVAEMTGMDINILSAIANKESGFRWGVKAGTSSATGLFQFINSTWKATLKKYGAKYGLGQDADPKDPRANALMGAEFLKENANALKSIRPDGVNATDLYIAHFLGAGGAKKFFSAGPNAIGANVFPEAARANGSIFYNNKQPRTLGEIYQLFKKTVEGKVGAFDSGAVAKNDGRKNVPTGAIASTGTATTAPVGGPGKQVDSKATTFASSGQQNVPTSNSAVAPVNYTPPTPNQSQSKSFADTSVKTQQNAVKEESAKSFANVETLLTQSLTEHVNQTALLRQVVALLAKKGVDTPMVKDPDSKSMNNANKPVRQTSDLPRNPVSVAKAM